MGRLRAARLAAIVIAGLVAASCASVTYVDASGGRHVVGFANVTIPPSANAAAPSVVSVTTLGLAVHMASPGQSAAMTLGYDRQTVLDMPANACVDLAHDGPCAASAGPASPLLSNRANGATQ